MDDINQTQSNVQNSMLSNQTALYSTNQENTSNSWAVEGTDSDSARQGFNRLSGYESTMRHEDSYQFDMPEGFELNENLTAELMPILKENNLNQDVAQSLVNLHIKAMQDMQKQTNDAWYGQEKVWLETIGNDPELSNAHNQHMALQAVKQFGTPELSKLLEDTRLGSHPELVRLFIKIGKAVSEDSTVNGTAGNTRQLPRDETGGPMLSFKTM